MLRTVRVWVGALLLSMVPVSGARAAAAPAPAAEQAGYVLLDKLVLFFNQTASSTTARYDTINQAINTMMAEAKAAKAERRIDEEFFKRYTRVLRIFKLRITEDKEGLLGPILDEEYTAFVKDVTRKNVQGTPSIAVLAQAVTQELENLKKLLDRK